MKNLNDVDVVILCGGLGKRLRSEVGQTQKTMASIDGEPFMTLLLKYLRGQGFRRAILCVGYYAERVMEHYQDRDLGIDIIFSQETDPLGTGGAIKNAREHVQGDIFFALNGDCFCEIAYVDILQQHLQTQAQVTLVVSGAGDRNDFGSIMVGPQGKIVKFVEKMGDTPVEIDPGAKCYISNGIYCFDRAVFDLMPEQEAFSIEYDFFHALPAKLGERFRAYIAPNSFIDIGVPERYREAQEKLKKFL